MAVALKSAGFDVLLAEDECLAGGAGSVDCYVQLPHHGLPPRGDPLGWAHAVVSETVLARLARAARIAPLLAPQARVVLVTEAGEPPAATGLLRSLLEAILPGHGHRRVGIAVVEGMLSPADIADVAAEAPPVWTDYRRWRSTSGFVTGTPRSWP